MLLQKVFDNTKHVKIVSGGDMRFHSVQCGLKEIEEKSVVFVHDARSLFCFCSVNSKML